MTELTGWKRKAILLFKSEKRLGAKRFFSDYTNKSYQEMKTHIIKESDLNWEIYEDKSRIKDLNRHLNKVKKEFIGKSELCYYHAVLVVLLRRSYKPEQTFLEFENLWKIESDFLLQSLSLRWIVSACDTFVDYSGKVSNNWVRAGILMNVVTLINTLKVYETQDFIYECDFDTPPKKSQLDKFSVIGPDLYAGLTYFRIGKDDTLKNMLNRYKSFSNIDPIATKILLHVFETIQHLDTAYAFMKSLHYDKKGTWWESQLLDMDNKNE